MIRTFILFFVAFGSISLHAADLSPTPGGSQIKQLELPKPPPKVEERRPQPLKKTERKFSTLKPIGAPGVVAFENGSWVGSDYLGHLSNKIGISVEILQSGSDIPVNEATLLQLSSELFQRQGIDPNPMIVEGEPPLPFLHILVMVYTNDGQNYFVFTAFRLFEKVNVIRERFEPLGSWQAITWENQYLEVAKRDQLPLVIKKNVEDGVNIFLTRYREYNPPVLK